MKDDVGGRNFFEVSFETCIGVGTLSLGKRQSNSCIKQESHIIRFEVAKGDLPKVVEMTGYGLGSE